MSKREKRFHKLYQAEIQQYELNTHKNIVIVFFLTLIALLSN
jgi:hypothetical protein